MCTTMVKKQQKKRKMNDLWSELNAGQEISAPSSSKAQKLLQTKKKGKKKKQSTDLSFRVPTLSLDIAHTNNSVEEDQKRSTSTAYQPSRKALALARKILEGQKCHSNTGSSTVSKKRAKAQGQNVKFSMPTLGVDTKNRQRKGFDSERKDQMLTEDVVKFAGKEYSVYKKTSKHAVKSESALDQMIDAIKDPKKVTTVEKSSMDWDKFKVDKGLEDELAHATKDGYLAKQDFLHRVDHRQFEIEKTERERHRLQQK